MITKATIEQVEEIRNIWRVCFPKEDPNYVDYYFKTLFKPENCFVYLLDGKIISCVIRNKHVLMFNGRALQASMIVGVATLPEYQKQGYMKALMDIVMDACENTELLTIIKTEVPTLYQQWNFKPAYKRCEYTITRSDCKRTTNFGCSYNPTAIDLLKVYSAFISRFNGYYARDLEYFVNYIKEIRSTGGKFIAYFNGKDQIQGYAAMVSVGDTLIVQELIYLDALSLTKLVNAALQEKKIVKLLVSEAEDLTKVFVGATRREYTSAWLRLNDEELFSKLFGKKVNDVEDVISISHRPMNLNENA